MSAAGEPESSKDSDIGPICDLALAELIIDVLGLEEEPYAVAAEWGEHAADCVDKDGAGDADAGHAPRPSSADAAARKIAAQRLRAQQAYERHTRRHRSTSRSPGRAGAWEPIGKDQEAQGARKAPRKASRSPRCAHVPLAERAREKAERMARSARCNADTSKRGRSSSVDRSYSTPATNTGKVKRAAVVKTAAATQSGAAGGYASHAAAALEAEVLLRDREVAQARAEARLRAPASARKQAGDAGCSAGRDARPGCVSAAECRSHADRWQAAAPVSSPPSGEQLGMLPTLRGMLSAIDAESHEGDATGRSPRGSTEGKAVGNAASCAGIADGTPDEVDGMRLNVGADGERLTTPPDWVSEDQLLAELQDLEHARIAQLLANGLAKVLERDASSVVAKYQERAERLTAQMDAAEAVEQRMRELAAVVEACKAEVLGREDDHLKILSARASCTQSAQAQRNGNESARGRVRGTSPAISTLLSRLDSLLSSDGDVAKGPSAGGRPGSDLPFVSEQHGGTDAASQDRVVASLLGGQAGNAGPNAAAAYGAAGDACMEKHVSSSPGHAALVSDPGADSHTFYASREHRSRQIAQQLARLQEESRHLQEQSNSLQSRAIEMQRAAGIAVTPPPAAAAAHVGLPQHGHTPGGAVTPPRASATPASVQTMPSRMPGREDGVQRKQPRHPAGNVRTPKGHTALQSGNVASVAEASQKTSLLNQTLIPEVPATLARGSFRKHADRPNSSTSSAPDVPMPTWNDIVSSPLTSPLKAVRPKRLQLPPDEGVAVPSPAHHGDKADAAQAQPQAPRAYKFLPQLKLPAPSPPVLPSISQPPQQPSQQPYHHGHPGMPPYGILPGMMVPGHPGMVGMHMPMPMPGLLPPMFGAPGGPMFAPMGPIGAMPAYGMPPCGGPMALRDGTAPAMMMQAPGRGHSAGDIYARAEVVAEQQRKHTKAVESHVIGSLQRQRGGGGGGNGARRKSAGPQPQQDGPPPFRVF